MKWFGVKTFTRTRAVGRPTHRDEHYRAGIETLEERIVLFRARDGESAIRKGLRDASAYAKGMKSTNIYGQTLVTTVLKFAEAYEMYDAPDEKVEAFSSMEQISARESEEALIRREIGKETRREASAVFMSEKTTEGLRAAGCDV